MKNRTQSSTSLTAYVVNAAMSACLLVFSVRADDGVWNVTTDGSHWAFPGNWFSGNVANGAGFAANFNLLDTAADTTVRLDTSRTIGHMIFGDADTSSSAGWILDNNGNPANVLTLSAATPTVIVNPHGTGKGVTISGAGLLAGTAGIAKSGAGTLSLAAPMSYTGQTTLEQGTLSLDGGDHTLRANNALMVNGGTLDLGGTRQYVSSLSGSGGTIAGSGALTVGVATDRTFAGSFQGGANLVRTGAANITLTLTGAGSTTGTVAVIGGNMIFRERGVANDWGGGLSLKDGGTLLNTTGVTIRNATLMLDNTGTANVTNRLNDTAPILLDNGTLRYMGQAGSSSTESVGAVTVSGFSTINVISGNNGYRQDQAPTVLTLANLTRNTGASIQFDRGDYLGRTGNNPRIFLANTNGLTFVNGTIPGMVAYTDNDKWYPVTYVKNLGFGRMGQNGFPNNYYSGGFAGENTLTYAATTHDFLTGQSQVVTGNQTINSLGIQGNGWPGNPGNPDKPISFEHADDTLTLASGWLAMWFRRTVIGSRTVRGAITSGQRELFLFGGYLLALGDPSNTGEIHSVIKDNETNAVMFVMSLGRHTYLTANNTYSGGTIVNGVLARESGTAFPNNLYLQGDPGAVVIPNAADPALGLVITGADVAMLTNEGQIGSSNIVTLAGSSTLALVGNNSLAGLVFNSNGGTTTPTLTPGGVLTLTGDIAATPLNVAVTPIVNGGTLDLGGRDTTVMVNALPEGNHYRSGANWTALNGLGISSTIRNGALTKTGDGVLYVTGNNTFAGQLTVEEGVLNVNALNNVNTAGPLGNNALAVILGGVGGKTGVVEYSANNSPAADKPFTLATGGIGGFQVDYAAQTTTLTGTIGGGGTLQKTGPGTLELTVGNTYTGGTIIGAGTLLASHAEAVHTSGDIRFTGGALRYTAASAGTDWSTRIRNSTGAIDLDSNGQSVTLAGALDASNSGGLIKSGAGTLILSGANAYSGVTTINAGTLQLGAAGAIPGGAGKGDVNVAATLDLNGFSEALGGLSGAASGVVDTTGSGAVTLTVGNNDANGVFAGVIRNSSGSLALTKVGSGMLTLSGANTYDGATTVTAGTLVGVTGGGCANSIVSVAGGATQSVRVVAMDGAWTCAGLLCSTGTASVVFEFGSIAPSATVAPLQVDGDLAVNETLQVVVRGNAPIPVGTYPLFRYTGSLSGTPPSEPLELPRGSTGSITNNVAGQSIDLAVSSSSTNVLSWRVGDGVWNTDDLNWKGPSGTATRFEGYEAVRFDDTASNTASIAVTLDVGVSPASVTVDNASRAYTLSGSGGIVGFSGLTKLGGGVLTNACSNSSFAGLLAVKAGTLSVSTLNNAGINGPLGGGAMSVLLGDAGNVTGTLRYTGASGGTTRKFTMATGGGGAMQTDRADAELTLSGVIDGGGSLTKTGGGTLALSGAANIYSGGTVVSGGTLAFTGDGSLGAVPGAFDVGNITLSGGCTLKEVVSGDTTLAANRGILLPDGVATIRHNGTGWLRIDGRISGSGGLDVRSDVVNAELRLTGANTFTGDTTLYAALANPVGGVWMALQNSTLNYLVSSGGAINFYASTGAVFGGLKGDKDLSLKGDQAYGVAISVGNNNQNTTYAGVLSNIGSLTKVGSGTLTLTRVNTYSGATTISGGSLKLGASGTINNSPSITIGAGAVLDVTDKSAYAMPANQTFTFGIDARGSTGAGRIVAQRLDIATAKVLFDSGAGRPNKSVYVLAEYSELVGDEFGSVADVPEGYNLTYGANRIELVTARGLILLVK